MRLQIDGEGTVGVEGDISVAEGVVERQGGASPVKALSTGITNINGSRSRRGHADLQPKRL
ncbi:hypothetical protein D3C76_1438280 [compost metagenome]